MISEEIFENTQNVLYQQFSTKWKLRNLQIGKNRTPEFCPLPDKSATFHFVISRQIIKSTKTSIEATELKVNLVKYKLPIAVHPFLSLYFLKVTLESMSKSFSKTFSSAKPINVSVMTSLDCIEYSSTSHEAYSKPERKETDETLVLSCNMTFTNHLCDPQQYINNSCLLDNFRHLTEEVCVAFQNGIYSDVIFQIGNNTFYAHKFILAAHSSVFFRLFEGDFKMANTNTITISDCPPDLFRSLLYFMYTGIVKDDVNLDNYKGLCFVAIKYDVCALKKKIKETLKAALEENTIITILDIVCEFSIEDLKEIVANFAASYFFLLVNKPEWAIFTSRYPRVALDIITLANSTST